MSKTSKKQLPEEGKTTHKQRIREIIKKPKDKFLTKSQEEYWKVLGENEITFCTGPSGTGKSYLSLKRAIDLLWSEDNRYEKLLIVRPLITVGKDPVGSLPGSLLEKLDPYMMPSFIIIDKIIGREARKKLIEEEIIEIVALPYLRGFDASNLILCVEESQNTSKDEMKLILTRIGYNSKFFISGDIEQSDKFKNHNDCGLYDAIRRLDGLKNIGTFEFTEKDIVRNPLISEILKKYKD